MGVLTLVDRAALAAYCQAWGRWVEAEEKLQTTPVMLKTPSGYVQQSLWLSVANKQLKLMGRYMAELGITPASRSRISVTDPASEVKRPVIIELRAYDPARSGGAAQVAKQMEPEAAQDGQADRNLTGRDR